jgi:ABC-type sugar transport system ATPase subunit
MVENNRLSGAPIRAKSQRALAERVIREVQIRPPDPNVLVGKLSGGNQQKVALGRWLARPPKVFLLDEPTRGVDLGAKSEIYRVIRELAARGTAVVISSSESGELLGICDRILMMFRGRVVASELCTELDEWKVAEHVAGAHHDL